MIDSAPRALPLAVLLSILAVGCEGAPESNATTGTGQSQAAAPPSGPAEGATIEFRSEPDPPKSGDNAIEVTVRQPDGTAVTDAAVSAVFSMPPMPAMNMPAMRSEVKLAHVEGGLYRGMGQLAMAGTWNVTVTATREGEPVGRRSFSVVAK